MEKLLLRVPEAAALVSISRSKGYELVASGEWPVVRIGRAVRIPVEALRAWVAQQQAEQVGSTYRRSDEAPQRRRQEPLEERKRRQK